MKMTTEEIEAAVKNGDITALTLDTSTFERKSFALEKGLLRRLSQFKDSEFKLVLSEIVVREVRAHLREKATDAEQSLRRSAADMAKYWNWPTGKVDAFLNQATEGMNGIDVSDERINKFISDCGAIVLDTSSFVSIGDVLNKYFDHTPPFSTNVKKKNEFPDAIALCSIEGWSQANNTRTLVISADKDWMSYSQESVYLICIEDLADGIAAFQGQLSLQIAQRISQGIIAGELPFLHDSIKDAISENSDAFEVLVECDSQFQCEEEGYDIDVESVEISSENGDAGVEPVEFDGDIIVLRILVNAILDITVYFSFAKWDGFDREYTSMGNGSATSTEDVPVEVLVAFNIENPNELEVVEIEVLPTTISVEFYELEPDWMQEPGDFD